MRATVLCLAGMHRSGTSLTARWLTASGVPLWHKNAIGASVGNTEGHYEDKDFVRLHARAIRRSAPTSEGWRIPHVTRLAFSTTERLRARKILWDRRSYDLWGWKDPRSVCFLDEWTRLIPQVKVLIVWRSQAATVDSLLRRSQKARQGSMLRIDGETAAGLWEGHTRALVDHALRRPDEVAVVHVDQLLEDGDRVRRRVEGLLRMPLPRRIDLGEMLNGTLQPDAPPTHPLEQQLRLLSYSVRA